MAATRRAVDFGTLGARAALLLLLASRQAHGACHVEKYGELPVMMDGRRPHIDGTINGSPAKFIADSGAWFSILWSDRIDRFKLRLRNKSEIIGGTGFGGQVEAHRTTVDDFSLRGLGASVFHNVQFQVVGNSIGVEDGVIGLNILGRADTEYDLGSGTIRLFHSEGCDGYAMAYWHGNLPIAEMSIRAQSDTAPHIVGTARLNGQELAVILDTGAPTSVLSLKVARQAGFDPAKAESSHQGHGSPLGGGDVEYWIGRFDELDLGGEKVRNVRLKISDSPAFAEMGADMLLGADFFLSHRIYVANSQHKLYYTFNGGRVFDLADRTDDTASAGAVSPSSTPLAAAAAEASMDAAAHVRRAAAALNRGDLAQAMADADAAIRLDPKIAEGHHLRAAAKARKHDPAGALADYDAALQLQPDNAQWLAGRGAVRLALKDEAGATADFDEFVRRAPATDDPELSVADFYADDGRYELAIGRVTHWIEAHPTSANLQSALNTRCWYRAKWGQQLDQALADCNAALKGRPSYGEALDSRGLVWLRLGRYDDSVSDYKAALRVSPKRAWSLYGLGLAQLRNGDSVAGNRSMQEALAVDSQAAANFKAIGLVP